MKIGEVTSDGDALVRVAVYDTDENAHDVHAVLDTSFNGFLALPARLIEEFGLAYRNELQIVLASGEKRAVSTYEATLRWDGERRSAVVIEAGEALAGMALFWGHVLRVDCTEGGAVHAQERA